MNLLMNHLPTFDITLPLTKDKVKFRPFVMKEEKLLLMAAESNGRDDILNALETSVHNCTFGKVSCETHPMVDIQYLFLQIRGKSVGEDIEFNLVCGSCQTQMPGSVNVTDIKISYSDNHSAVIDISSGLKVTMKYPKLRHLSMLQQNDTTIEVIYDIVSECIEKIESGDEIFTGDTLSSSDAREFIDNLTSSQFEKIKVFFDTMPVIQHEMRFTCGKCAKDNVVLLDEIVNFFV